MFYSYPVEINGESYLYSIVIDQTDFVLLQNRDKILIASIIVLLVLGVLSAISSIIVLSRKSKNLKHSEQRFEAFAQCVIWRDSLFMNMAKY